MAKLKIFSVVFDWDPPQERNGILTSYILTYSVNGSSPTTQTFTNTSITEFTVEFPPGTNVTAISVHATTSVGPGIMSTADDVAIPTVPTPRELALCDTVHGLCE